MITASDSAGMYCFLMTTVKCLAISGSRLAPSASRAQMALATSCSIVNMSGSIASLGTTSLENRGPKSAVKWEMVRSAEDTRMPTESFSAMSGASGKMTVLKNRSNSRIKRGYMIDGTYRMLAWPSEGMLNSSSKISTPGNLARIFATCRSYTGTITHPSRSGSDLPEARVANSVMGRSSDSKGPITSSLERDTMAKRIRGCFQSLFCGC